MPVGTEALESQPPPPPPPASKRALLALGGTFERSAPVAWPSVAANIVAPLRAGGFAVSIYGFELQPAGALVDGVRSCAPVLSLARGTPIGEYDSLIQAEADAAAPASLLKPDLFFCDSPYARRTHVPLGNNCSINVVRQLLSESRVARFLEANAGRFDVAVALQADYFVATPIDMRDVGAAMGGGQGGRFVYLSDANDAFGFTNGFYLGPPRAVAAVMGRLDAAAAGQLDTSRDYERLLKSAFELLGIERRVSRLAVFKVRANCGVHWQGIGNPCPRTRREKRHHRCLRRNRFDHVLDGSVAAVMRVQQVHRALVDLLRGRGNCACGPRIDAGPVLAAAAAAANASGGGALSARCSEVRECWMADVALARGTMAFG